MFKGDLQSKLQLQKSNPGQTFWIGFRWVLGLMFLNEKGKLIYINGYFYDYFIGCFLNTFIIWVLRILWNIQDATFIYIYFCAQSSLTEIN